MAGVDKDYRGRGPPAARHQDRLPAAGAGTGPSKDRARQRRGGPRRDQGCPWPRNEVYAAYAEPGRDFDALAEEQGKLEDILEAAGGHNMERKLEVAADALRLPPWDAEVKRCPVVSAAAWPCAACCCPTPTCCCWTSPPTTWTPNRGLAGALPARVPGTVVAVTHDRYFLDNVPAGFWNWTAATAFPGKATTPPGWNRKKSAWSRKPSREAPASEPSSGAGVGAQNPKGRQAKSKARLARFEELQASGIPEAQRDQRALHPAGPAPGRLVVEANGVPRPSATRCCTRTWTSTCRVAPSSASSAPTAPARPPCSA
jgi:energy-dependent translational throttle protein EttA